MFDWVLNTPLQWTHGKFTAWMMIIMMTMKPTWEGMALVKNLSHISNK